MRRLTLPGERELMKKILCILTAFMVLTAAAFALADGVFETASLKIGGAEVTAYAVRPFDLTDNWGTVGYWGSRFAFGSTETTAFELKGAIRNCYGVTFTYAVDNVDYGDLESVGIKPGMRMGKKWTCGDKGTTVYPVTGEPYEFTVLNKKPGTLSAVTVVTDRAMNSRLSYSGSYWPDFTLWFASEDAAESYAASLN